VRLGEEVGFFSVHVFCLGHMGMPTYMYVTSPPRAGVPEGPVTGSASGAMGA